MIRLALGVVAAVAALGFAWLVWARGGAAAAALGLGAFDPLARLALGVLALTLAEAALARLAPPSDPPH